MGEYHQLTEEDRIEIYALLKAGKSNSEIGQVLGRSTSTLNTTVSVSSIDRHSTSEAYDLEAMTEATTSTARRIRSCSG